MPTSMGFLRGTASAVLLAAGRGRRFGALKQFARVAGWPLLYWPLRTLALTPAVREIVVVVPASRRAWGQRFAQKHGAGKVRAVVAGGRERADSVRAGLAATSGKHAVLLIHDSARALVSRAVIERVRRAAERTGVALAAQPVPDTIKRGALGGRRVRVTQTLSRQGLWLAQTPQGFRHDVLARVAGGWTSTLTDDVQAAERRGMPVELVPGSALNFKVTVPEDLILCQRLLKHRGHR